MRSTLTALTWSNRCSVGCLIYSIFDTSNIVCTQLLVDLNGTIKDIKELLDILNSRYIFQVGFSTWVQKKNLFDMLINVWRFLALLFFFNSEYCILFSIQNLQNMSSQSNIQMHTIYYSDILEVLAIRAKFVNCYDFFQKNMASRKLPENYQSPHNSSSLTQNLPHPFLTISGFFFSEIERSNSKSQIIRKCEIYFFMESKFLRYCKMFDVLFLYKSKPSKRLFTHFNKISKERNHSPIGQLYTYYTLSKIV